MRPQPDPASSLHLSVATNADKPALCRHGTGVRAMFERSRVDTLEHGTLCVRLTLADGEDVTAKIVIPPGRSVFELLNGNGSFIEIEAFDGERSYVSKTSLREVKLLAVAKVPNLVQRTRDLDGFDPHSVLGVGKDADWEAVKNAHRTLAKAYHPDRFASLSLPAEVAGYLEAMARRINSAYAFLEAAEAEKARRNRPRGFGNLVPAPPLRTAATTP